MLVASLAALAAVACLVIVLLDSGGGETGERGPAGPAGVAGVAGTTGATGKAGTSGFDGAAGVVGAAGPAGPQGPRGATGATGEAGARGIAGAAGPVGDTGPQGCEGPAGAAGPAGETGPQGCEGPVGATGAQGAPGPAGPEGSPGADGRTILSGSGPPTESVGENGDFYIDTASEEIFGPKTDGDWGVGTSAVGPEGPPGPQGEQGLPGTNGKTVLSGAGVPDPGLGSDGDFYLDTSSNTIYGPKSGGSWGGGTSLVGPAGPQGEQGEQGVQGVAGRTILSGPGAPLPDVGADGDFYIDTSAEDIYGPKTDGAWGSPTSLVGPAGETGEQGVPGADGRSVLSGSGAPDPGLGSDGDFYIDTTALTIYGPKSGGAWGSPTSLVGPQGPVGDTGPAGEQGPQGEIGPAGPGVAPAYGAFHSTGDQAPGAGSAVTPIVLDSTDESDGVTLDAPGGAAITVAAAGVYNFQFSAQVTKTDAGTDVLYLWPQIDTGSGWADIDWSNSSINLTAANQRSIPAWNFVLTMPAGAKFRIVMASTDTAFRVDTITGVTGPDIPGLILTATRVG